jgi:putative flippase GtrA
METNQRENYPLPVRFLLSMLDRKIIRYLINGAVLFVIDTTVLYLLRRIFGIDIRVAKVLSRIVSTTIGFFTHKYLVFRNKKNKPLHVSLQGVAFATLLVINMGLSAGLAWLLEQVIRIPTIELASWLVISNLLVINVITEGLMAIETFFVLNVIFHQKKDEKKDDDDNKADTINNDSN